jgi:hypothetical protein
MYLIRDLRWGATPKAHNEFNSAIQTNQLYFHGTSIMISFGVGFFFLLLTLIIYCCCRHFGYTRRGGAQPSQPFYSHDTRRAADAYYQGMSRRPEDVPPHYEMAVRRPEMPQVQLDAVSTLVDQLRAAHTAPI